MIKYPPYGIVLSEDFLTDTLFPRDFISEEEATSLVDTRDSDVLYAREYNTKRTKVSEEYRRESIKRLREWWEK